MREQATSARESLARLKQQQQGDWLLGYPEETGGSMRHLFKRPSPAMIVACLSLFVALSGVTYAATGGNFILGRANTATNQTSLTAGVSSSTAGGGKVLQLTNSSTAAGAEGVGITVGTNKAPIRVNLTAGKAANLNVDRLDGLDSTAFLRTTGKAADADKLDGLDSAQLSPAAGDGRTADLALIAFEPQTVLSANITTARPAALLVTAAVDLSHLGTSAAVVECWLRFDNSANSPIYATTVQGQAHDTLPLVWAPGVGAGTHTVELRCTGPTDLIVDDAGMNVSAHV
jgi:hypothetical protein